MNQESFHEKSESILAIVTLSALMLTLIYAHLATTTIAPPDDAVALFLVSLSPTFHCFISCLFVRGPKARRLAKKPPSKLPPLALSLFRRARRSQHRS